MSKTWLEEFEFDVNFAIFGLKIQLTAHFKRCTTTIEYGEINAFTPLTGATAESMVFDNSMANPNFKLTYIIYSTEWQHVGCEVVLNYDPWSNTTDVSSNCSCLLLRKFKFELTDLPKLNNTSCVTF